VIFVCQHDRILAQRDHLMPAGKSHSVIYNGVACPEPADDSAVSLPRAIGFVGRLVDQKHPELFLEVVDRLPGQSAVMAGGGPLAAALDREITRRGLAQRLKRLGELNREATLSVIAGLDVLVMTSRWEGLPLLPLEAMHLGVPVVSTAVGGVTEIIEHERTGLLADESPAALAAAVERLRADPVLRGEIVEAARRDVRTRFSETGMLEAIETLYDRLNSTSPSLAGAAP
jgi:glycosyltransferase involved in cell wall biosynthesis